MKVGFVDYPKGKLSRPHFHPNEEQFLLNMDGRQFMIVGDEEKIVGPGDLVHIPRNTKHAGIILDDVTMFTVKNPAGDGSFDQDHNDAEDAVEITQYVKRKLQSLV